MTKPTFDMAAAIQALREGKNLIGQDGILTPLIKQLTPNRKNGTTDKTVKDPTGSFELKTPRDRAGIFDPPIVRKHQTHLTDELERKIIGLFALGTSYQDIRGHSAKLYGISLSNGTINTVTDKLLPELQAWREHDLEAIYPVVWLDAIHYKIKGNGRYISKAIYTTNAVETVHRQFRKLTKTKDGFANENSLLKLLYAGILKASERWTYPVQNWNLTLSQMAIHFPGHLENHIRLWGWRA